LLHRRWRRLLLVLLRDVLRLLLVVVGLLLVVASLLVVAGLLLSGLLVAGLLVSVLLVGALLVLLLNEEYRCDCISRANELTFLQHRTSITMESSIARRKRAEAGGSCASAFGDDQGLRILETSLALSLERCAAARVLNEVLAR